eukprot:410811-Pelagomonas_calceolata.AAC.1
MDCLLQTVHLPGHSVPTEAYPWGKGHATPYWSVLWGCGHKPSQFYWFRAALKFYNEKKRKRKKEKAT